MSKAVWEYGKKNDRAKADDGKWDDYKWADDGKWATNKKDCHWGARKVATVNSVQVLAGGWNRGLRIPKRTLVINLTGVTVQQKAITNTGLDLSGWTYPEILLPIKDFGIPFVDSAWWVSFADRVMKHCKANGLDVLVCCDGGHGRTGMVLAILLWHWRGKPKTDMVTYVRSIYCENAVETDEQWMYVLDCTGGK